LEVFANGGEGLEEKLEVVRKWARKWRMKVNVKKSEVVVFGGEGVEKPEGWKIGEDKIMEKEETKCLGIVFEGNGRRRKFMKQRCERAGGVIGYLGEVRRVLGERAALRAWRMFGETVLLFGAEVMVWKTVEMQQMGERVQRKALRMVLGLDIGVNNEVLYGETGEGRMSARAEERMLKWGDRIEESEERMVRKQIRKAREVNGRDKWKKYEKEVKKSLEGEGSERKGWKKRLEEREHEEWKKRMDRSEQSLGVYRKVVTKRGEMKRVGTTWHPVIRAWWRRLRSGMVIGKNRGNWWNGLECLFCEKEKGGIEHFALECENEDVRGMIENVLDAMTIRIRSRDVEEWERWEQLVRKEKIWCALGKNGEEWKTVREKGGEIWWIEWKDGQWDARLKDQRERKKERNRREGMEESWFEAV
jgi:hypothetical protein